MSKLITAGISSHYFVSSVENGEMVFANVHGETVETPDEVKEWTAELHKQFSIIAYGCIELPDGRTFWIGRSPPQPPSLS